MPSSIDSPPFGLQLVSLGSASRRSTSETYQNRLSTEHASAARAQSMGRKQRRGSLKVVRRRMRCSVVYPHLHQIFVSNIQVIPLSLRLFSCAWLSITPILYPFLAFKGERIRNGCHLLVSRGAEIQGKLHEVSSPSIVNRVLSVVNWNYRFSI